MSSRAGRKTSEVRRLVHRSGDEVELPVGRIVGARSGPRFGVSAGMHAGEPAGVRAAMRVWQEVDPADLSGELVVIPIMSTRSFFARSMQLAAADEREVHGQAVGRPEASYSEFMIDAVFNVLKDLDFHVDLHAGEHVQALDPWVRVPEPSDERLRLETWRLATCFPVPYLHPMPMDDSGSSLPAALFDAGVANLWTEIGQNAIQDESDIDGQYRGVMNALRRFGLLDGEPEDLPRHEVVGPRIWRPLAEASGYWRPHIRAGEWVTEGQLLGELFDFDGARLTEFVAPWDGLVQLVWTSPAINVDRQPHGYQWHQGLFGIVEVRGERAPVY